jgi:molecular chaperone DnaK
VVEVHVLQGERDLAKYNRSLAKFELVGIPPSPRGAPQIEVTFDIDANGIASVSAKEKISGREQAIRVTPSTGLSQNEIDKMIVEARQFAESDRKMREATEFRNRIKGLTSSVSRSYSEFGRLLDAPDQEMVKNILQKARTLPPEETNPSVLKDLHFELENAATKLTSAMFGAPEEALKRAKAASEPSVQQIVSQALEDVSGKKP